MELFSDNTAARFKVQLPRELTLPCDFEFALIELHYPCTFFNVRQEQNMLDFYVGGQNLQFFLKPGYYGTTADLSFAVNKLLESMGAEKFANDAETGYLVVPSFADGVPHRFNASEILALQLGFEPCRPLSLVRNKVIEKQTATRLVDPSLGLPSTMLVYCDLAEPQLYSDVVTSCIRTVNIDTSNYKYGNMACRTYARPIYVPVQKRQFQTVEVHIREMNGALMPFAYGTCHMVLHFRPIGQ